jgi:hypothetical protein
VVFECTIQSNQYILFFTTNEEVEDEDEEESDREGEGGEMG